MPPPVSSGQRRWLLATLAVGAMLRIAWATYAARDPQTLADPALYGLFAEQIADGEGYRFPNGEPTAYYPPGYPMTLGAVVWLVQLLPVPYHLPTVVAWFNVVLGVATIVLVFEVARRVLGDNRVGLVAAAIVALWPNLIFHTAVALTETLFNLLVLVAILVLVARPWDRRPAWVPLVGFGLLLGASVMVRPVSLLLLPALGWVWWRRTDWDGRWVVTRLGAVTAATFAVILPWTVRNAIVMDSPVLISTNFGDNLCIGRHPGATGAFRLAGWCFDGYEGVERPEFEIRRNDDTTRKALEYLVEHPVDEVRLLLWRAYHTVHDDHDGLAAAESYGDDPFMSERWRDVWAWAADLWFFGVLAVGVVGLVAVRGRTDPRLSMLRWTMVALAVPPLLFFGDVRFKMPVVPFLAMMAAVAVVRLAEPQPQPQAAGSSGPSSR